MMNRLCILLAVLILSACGSRQVYVDADERPPQETAAPVSEADPVEEPSGNAPITNAPEPEQTESTASAPTEAPSVPPDASTSAAQSPEEKPTGEAAFQEEVIPPAHDDTPPPSEDTPGAEEGDASQPSQEDPLLKITVGDYELLADFEDNSSAAEFQELLSQGPVTIEMQDYGGFEKVGPLGTELTRNDTQITTAPGDVILYQGNQITIYYGTNSWSFTRLARIHDPTGLQEKLGEETVSITFSLS